MKLTAWFPADVKPVHAGVYETQSPVFEYEENWYSFWDGVQWGQSYHRLHGEAVDAAYRNRRPTCYQDHPWRGLAEKPE
jgi:hypothetical protein